MELLHQELVLGKTISMFERHRGYIHSVILFWLVLPHVLKTPSFLFDFGKWPMLTTILQKTRDLKSDSVKEVAAKCLSTGIKYSELQSR